MEELLDALVKGNAVILETDTVYGLAALPKSRGCELIFELKDRPREQVLPLLISSSSMVDGLACDVHEYAMRLMEMFWPGALTLVLRASAKSREICEVADDGTIAVRCPDRIELLNLIEAIGIPLACTSANEHGAPLAFSPDQIPPSMLELTGATALGALETNRVSSTIVDCTGDYPVILREGPIPVQVILDVAVYGAKLSS